MAARAIDVVVAGHICLDVIPTFSPKAGRLDRLLAPGTLTNVGRAHMAPGGAVANTGLALHQLGITPRLIGKVGADLFGRALVDLLQRRQANLADGMIVAEEEATSYTIVISPPGVDRIFLHCSGANDTFRADEVPVDQLSGPCLFHFGYPTLMRQTYADGGRRLAALFKAVGAQGGAVSLDMSHPDPNAEAGAVDWKAWLARVLPHVAVFAPSLEEILFMLNRRLYEELTAGARGDGLAAHVDTRLLDRIADQLIELGASLVFIKLGDQGLYVRSAENVQSLGALDDGGSLDVPRWSHRHLLIPCFDADVEGTTGAGDATGAGLLAGLCYGLSPEETLRSAVAVGACSVEAPDATSGIPDWKTVQSRMQAGWKQKALSLRHPSWSWREDAALWIGPEDST